MTEADDAFPATVQSLRHLLRSPTAAEQLEKLLERAEQVLKPASAAAAVCMHVSYALLH